MKTLLKLLALIALAVVTSLILGWASNTMWTWYVGPSIGIKGWFTVFMISNLVFSQNTAGLAKLQEDTKKSIYQTALERQIGLILAALATVGLSWLTGQAWGWL